MPTDQVTFGDVFCFVVIFGGLVLLVGTIIWILEQDREKRKARTEKVLYDTSQDTKKEKDIWYAWSDELYIDVNNGRNKVIGQMTTLQGRSIYSKSIEELLYQSGCDQLAQGLFKNHTQYLTKIEWDIKIGELGSR